MAKVLQTVLVGRRGGPAFGNSAVNGYLWDGSNMCKVRKIHLLAVNGLLWMAIGTKIAVTGGVNYLKAAPGKLGWMIPSSLLVFAAFYLMFTGIVRKYSERIQALPGPTEPIYKTFSLKGYLIIAFMITLGITLKYVPGIPQSFFAWFYLGLGAGLLSAGVRFLIRWRKGLIDSMKS